MKCPNCGGEVSVNDIKCPYCQTPNPEGIHFQEEVRKRKHFNQTLRQKLMEQMRVPLLQRCINLSILFLFLLLIVQLAVSLGIYLITEENILGGLSKPADYEEQMAKLYEEGSYGELNAFMDQYHLEKSDYPVYTQMCLLEYDYQNFLEHIMFCMEAMEQGKMPDDYHLEYAIRTAENLLNPHIPAYPDIYPENQAPLDAYQREAAVCLAGMFHLTADELLTLTPPGDGSYRSSYEAVDRLYESAAENLRKEGYVHEE